MVLCLLSKRSFVVSILLSVSSSTIGRCVVKGANSTVSSPSLDLEVAILSKPCCPRVLDKPVVDPSLVAVPNNCHLMVKIVLALGVSGLVATSSIVVYSTIVVAQPRGLNGGGNWIDVDQLLHIALICVPQVVLAGHAAVCEVTIACRATTSIFGSVRVRRLSLDFTMVVVHKPVHVRWGPCTVTAKGSPGSLTVLVVVVQRTVNNVLLGQVVKHDPSLLPEACFKDCYSGEGSTTSTLALVLDGRNATLFNPTPGVRGRLGAHLSKLLQVSIISSVNKDSCVIVCRQA